MRENIGIQLTSIVAPIVPLALGEAEAYSYPYAVYESTPSPIYVQGRVFAYASDVTLTMYDTDFARIQGIADQVQDAIGSAMSNADYMATIQSSVKDSVEGVWYIELRYMIKQYNDN